MSGSTIGPAHEMTEYKERISAASGSVVFTYDAQRGVGVRGSGFRTLYCVAVSMDGRHLLATVPGAGIGQISVYPKPSVLAYIQSDEQGMWGRNCPSCRKYFRSTHVMGPVDVTFCPYCARSDACLAFVSKEQLGYVQAFYDAYARAYIGRATTRLDMGEITDLTPAWHYSEEKQQFHFICGTPDCQTQTDILGRYGYCPRCGRTNARKLFAAEMDEMLRRLDETCNTVQDRNARGETWEDMTVKSVSKFEALAKHLRNALLRFPMTPNRRKALEGLNFQRPLDADNSLSNWFDIGLLRSAASPAHPWSAMAASEPPFIGKMFQKRHILSHNDGIVDQDYLDLSGDTTVRLGERIRVRSKEARRFLEGIRQMGENFLNNVEYGFEKR